MEYRFYAELHKWCENIWLFVHCFFFISHFHYIDAAVEWSKYNWKGTNKFLCCIAHFSKIKAINVSAAYFHLSSSTSDYIRFWCTFSRWHIESRQLIIWKYFERRNIINCWYSSLRMHQSTCMWTVNKLWTTPFNFIPRFTVSIASNTAFKRSYSFISAFIRWWEKYWRSFIHRQNNFICFFPLTT